MHFAAAFGQINTLLMLINQYNIDPREESNVIIMHYLMTVTIIV